MLSASTVKVQIGVGLLLGSAGAVAITGAAGAVVSSV